MLIICICLGCAYISTNNAAGLDTGIRLEGTSKYILQATCSGTSCTLFHGALVIFYGSTISTELCNSDSNIVKFRGPAGSITADENGTPLTPATCYDVTTAANGADFNDLNSEIFVECTDGVIEAAFGAGSVLSTISCIDEILCGACP